MQDSLNPEQRRAVEHGQGPLLILAGAGSGKTRVITYRAAHLIRSNQAAPEQILCVTFTNKACREMAHRIVDLVGPNADDIVVRTFHSFGLQLIRRGDLDVGIDPRAVVYDETDQRQVMRDALVAMGLDPEKINPRGIIQAIDRHKQFGRLPNDLGDDELVEGLPLREFYQAYQHSLARNNALDFGDLLLLPVRALREQPQCRERLQERFHFVMVDEFQDTNRIQYELIRLIAGHGNLAVVGDDDQSIYSWRGADISNILGFERDYPQATVIKLEQNYRSTANILKAAWEVVRHNPDRKPKQLWTNQAGGDRLQLAALVDEREEAAWVVEQVEQQLQAGIAIEQIAVFYRTNSQSRMFEEAFRARNIAYRVIGATGFYDRKEIKDVLAYLRLLANPRDLVSFSRIANLPRRGVGETSLQKVVQAAMLENTDVFGAIEHACSSAVTGKAGRALLDLAMLLKRYRELAQTLSLSILTADLIKAIGLNQAYDSEGVEVANDRRENIEQLLVSMQDYEREQEHASLANYLDAVSLVQDRENNHRPSVSLMTLHSAKGLEFDVVFFTGLEDGILPHNRSLTTGDDAEERRLCYVGMTRARKRLFLTRARTRRTFGAILSQRQSPYLRDVPRELLNDVSPSLAQNDFPYKAPARSWGAAPANRQPAHTKVIADHPVVSQTPVHFCVGARLRHPAFGVGEVLECTPSVNGFKLKMRFSQGVKTILPSLVELTPLK